MSKICGVCGKENPDDAEFCQECGANLNQEKIVDSQNSKIVEKRDIVKKRSESGKGLIYMGLFFILAGIIFNYYINRKLQEVFGGNVILTWNSPGNIITLIIIIAGLFSIIRGFQIFSGETDKERKINKLNTVTWFLIIELPFLYFFTSEILPPIANTSPYTILPIFYFLIFVLLLCIYNWKKNKYLGKNTKRKRKKRR